MVIQQCGKTTSLASRIRFVVVVVGSICRAAVVYLPNHCGDGVSKRNRTCFVDLSLVVRPSDNRHSQPFRHAVCASRIGGGGRFRKGTADQATGLARKMR